MKGKKKAKELQEQCLRLFLVQKKKKKKKRKQTRKMSGTNFFLTLISIVPDSIGRGRDREPRRRRRLSRKAEGRVGRYREDVAALSGPRNDDAYLRVMRSFEKRPAPRREGGWGRGGARR